MKKIFSKTAYTLIELIVSLLLASVVILGIYSIDEVLNNNSQDYGQRYLVKSETQATLNHILNNAALAVGDGRSDSFGNADLGILSGAGNPPGAGDANSFCIHQAGTSDTPPGQNIVNSATDIWLCYTWSAYQIYWCTLILPLLGAIRLFVALCPLYRRKRQLHISRNSLYCSCDYICSGNNRAFSVTLQNCLNDAASGCSSSGTSTDQVNNPEVQISGTVFPPQEGTG